VLAVVAVVALAAHSRGGAPDDNPRIVLWGDSLAWEAQDAFVRTAQAGGADVLVQAWGGTAICDWLDDMRVQLRKWKPTVAVLSFSGNRISSCMQGRDPLAAYRDDATAATKLLTKAGVAVRLVAAPPRPDHPAGADGMTDIARVWRSVVDGNTLAQVVDAGQVVTDHGRWVARLPCHRGEPCAPDGTVTVRSPDGVHFCPVNHPPMTRCPVYSAGGERFGVAMARATLDSLSSLPADSRRRLRSS
jgi:hypothetical protein